MAASSSSQSCIFDVFLSFRGEDTRKTFVDHLYSALVDRSISTYKDDEALPRGESIRPSLFKAIKGSQIAVIIFSKNYADSSWCLEELAYIMKCKDKRGLMVMPVFYDVAPSEVRKQEGDFGRGFSKQEVGNINKVESWRKALVHASEVAGWEPKNIANGHESKVIKEIVDTISDKMFSISPHTDEHLVGMGARMQELEAQLDIGSHGVLMVGVWGVGGSGKTTLASSLYMKISCHFQGHCIIDNVREESSKHGIKTLQEIFLLRLLQTEVKLQSVEEGKHMIRSRLKHSNVLVFLDDVDDCKQLDALVGSYNWFGSRSRILITTRDEHVLRTHKVDHVCHVTLLSHEEATMLFNKHAYNKDNHVNDYETLSSHAISYAAGLPLALKVLGSFLYDKNEKEWLSSLSRLKDIPDMEILEKLKISYYGLHTLEKELFLDISCFFKGKKTNDAIEIFEACGYHPNIGIKVLRQKALLAIVDGKFDMHDLIQEMGHYIVRGKHPNNPEKHSRIWKYEEIKNMCIGDATMDNYKIEAIRYGGDPSLVYKVVSNMKRLRWINLTTKMFFNAESAEAPSFLSNELRYINLDNYPQSVFPASFKPVKLITLKLSKSLQKELWKGYPHLPHLKVLQLQFMRYLLCTPDFDRLPCLQRLTLHCCGDLEEIHPSLGNHVCLEDLSVSYCEKLRLFPTIVRMRKLKTLVIYSCSRQLEFPRIKSDLASLVKLSLGNMGIDVMLSSTGEKRFPYLTSLHLNHCYLKNKEANFYASENLEEFKLIGFEMSAHLRISWLIWLQLVLSQSTHSLRKLDLSKCRLRDGEIPAHIGALSNLSELKLSSNDFSRLDFSLLQLTQLKHLALNNCNWLVELPKLPSSLEILEGNCCNSLTTIGDSYTNCKWLYHVSLMNSSIITDGNKLLHSLLQGKAIRNHFMLLRLQGLEIAKGFTPPLLSGIRYTLKLPDNWCNDYSGFLMCAVVKQHRHCYQEIYMEHVMSGMDSKDDVVWEESDGDTYTWVFYVSFAILRNTTWWNSTYKAIMIRNIHSKRMSLEGLCSGFGVRLVAWESGSGQTETIPTTDEEFQCSHYSPKFGISQPSTTFAIEFTPLLNFVGVF